MSEEQIINPACYNNAGVISMDRVERLLQETEKLTVEELRYLLKTLTSRRAVPLRDPEEFFDDWDDQEIDAAYRKKLYEEGINGGSTK